MKSKRLWALLWASAMTVSVVFAGCGSGNNGESSGSGDTSGAAAASSAGDSETAEAGEGYSSEIDMEEEPYTVAIQVVTLPGTDFDGEEDREAAINAITEPAINCKVDIQEVWISEIANTTSMAVAGDEKVDIVHVATVNPLSSLVGSDILLDMNEGNLLQNRGQKLVELFGEELEAGSVGGRQLAVPAKTFNAAGKGIFYNKTLADQYGIEIPEKITMDELNDILYQVHGADPDIMAYYTGDGTINSLAFLENYESFGSESSYGVVLDPENDPTVVNLYDTDLFRDYCVQAFHWTQDDIQPGDPTDTNTAQDYFNAQALFCVRVSINPEQIATWGAAANTAGLRLAAQCLLNR